MSPARPVPSRPVPSSASARALRTPECVRAIGMHASAQASVRLAGEGSKSRASARARRRAIALFLAQPMAWLVCLRCVVVPRLRSGRYGFHFDRIQRPARVALRKRQRHQRRGGSGSLRHKSLGSAHCLGCPIRAPQRLRPGSGGAACCAHSACWLCGGSHCVVSPVPAQMWARQTRSRRRCGRGASQSRCRCGSGEPSRCRCVSGEPSPGADVAGASPVPEQMWAGVGLVPVQMC
jgi:hypothetical protein